jgi:hypothetical protein
MKNVQPEEMRENMLLKLRFQLALLSSKFLKVERTDAMFVAANSHCSQTRKVLAGRT